MLVTDRHAVAGGELVGAVREAVAGGVRLVQVRERDLDEAGFAALVEALAAVLPADVRLLLNGRPGLSGRKGLGLHLPAAALSPRPPGVPLFGISVHDEEEARRALALDPDYLLAGTVFATASKPGRPPAGPGWITRLRRLAAGVPIYGIGGIGDANVEEVLRAGAHGVAVRSAILSASNVRKAAEALDARIRRAVGGAE
jgi:thiamine-phosphate pyrophosphorylase